MDESALSKVNVGVVERGVTGLCQPVHTSPPHLAHHPPAANKTARPKTRRVFSTAYLALANRLETSPQLTTFQKALR
jgi:hypothetical protein